MKKVIGRFILVVMSSALSFNAFGATEQPLQKYTVSIESPANNATFHSETDTIPVKVKIIPALKPKDELHVLVDGKLDANSTFGDSITAQDLSSEQTTINLLKLDRGEHSLQAFVYHPNSDNTKTKAGESAKILFTQQRASALLPAH